jgi:uncharacterized repeat protein (TIGR02543 family)
MKKNKLAVAVLLVIVMLVSIAGTAFAASYSPVDPDDQGMTGIRGGVTPALSKGNEENPKITSAKLYTSLSGGTLVCDLLDENASIPEWPVDEEYYLKVTVESSNGAEDWVSVSIPDQLYYTNTPGLAGDINHTALSKLLSYEDTDLTVNQTGVYARNNGTVKYQIKTNSTRASFFIGLRADSNFFNGNPSGMTVSDIIQIAVGNQGESNAAHTAQMIASITDNIPRVIEWVRGESLSNTNGVLDYPVTGFQRKNPYLCRTSHGADETLGIYTATYDLIYDKGADLNSVDCATILSTEEYNDDPTKMVAHCQSDLMSGRFRFKPVITYPSGAGFSVDQTYSIIVSNIDVTMYGDTSGFDASMGIEGTTLNITIVSPATSSFTTYARDAASYNWRLQDTPDKSYAAACDRLAWFGYKYDNPSVPCTEPLAFELFIDEGSDSAPGGQGLIHFATLPNWTYASVYWEAVNVDDPGDVKSGTIDGADLEYRYTTETGSTSFDDYVMVAVEDFGLDPSKYSLSYVKADVTTVPAGASSYGYNPAWMYYIDAHLMSPAVFGTFRSGESGNIYTRMKLSTVPSDGTDSVVKFQATSGCASNVNAGAFTAGRRWLAQSAYTINPGESLQLKNVYTDMGDFYYCSGWTSQGGGLLNDTSTVADPVLYMILPEGIGYRDLFLKIGDKPTEYTIEDITESATNPDTKTIFKISFPEGTMIGWYDENGDDRRLGINVELTSSYDTAPGTYVLSDMFFLGSEKIQAGWSGANGTTGPSSDTYMINNGRPLSRVIVENTVLSVQENDAVLVTNAVRTLDAEGNETAGWKTYNSYAPDDTTAILPISKEGSGELVLNVTNLVASRESLSQLTIYVPISKLDADMGEVFMNNPQEFSVNISVKDTAESSTKFDYAYAKLNSPCDGSDAPDCTIATTEEEIASADLMVITLKRGETLAYGRENTEKIFFEVRTDGKDGADGAVDLFTPFTIYTANETDIFAINDIVGFSIRAYTVTYHANGGENPPTDYESPYSPDSTVVVLDKANMTRENHVFTGWNTKSDGSGIPYLPQQSFTITQSVNLYAQWEEIATGSLTVSKTVRGSAASATKAFTFTVTLSDTSISGEYDEMTFENGVATFTLKGGESKTAEGLPAGIRYTVVESDNSGYRVTMTGDTGTIVDGETVTAAFTNTKNSSGGSPTPTPTPTPVPAPLNGDDHFAYVIGYPDGNVHPEANITRAEVATIFFRLLKDEVREANWSETNSFSDVTAGMWFNNAVSTMAKMGIVTGYPDGTFKPNENITRAEFAAIAARFDENANSTNADFSDISGHWAAVEIAKAAANGWVNGYPDGTFKPDQKITRAEAMALVNRVLNRDPEDPSDLLDNMIKWPDNMDTNKWYYLDVQEATNSHTYERTTKITEKWLTIEQPRDWAALER